MKKLLLTAFAVLLCTAVSAQLVRERSEVSVSYGLAPVTTWIHSYNDALISIFTGVDSDPSDWGAVTVGYNYRLTKKISLGLQVVYSTNEDKFSYKGQSQVTIRNRYWSLMPNVKYNWLNTAGIVSLYSRIGAGISFGKSESDELNESESHFAFQFSPIGIEVGRRLAGYAEAGVGVSGSLIVGARYRF